MLTDSEEEIRASLNLTEEAMQADLDSAAAILADAVVEVAGRLPSMPLADWWAFAVRCLEEIGTAS